MQSRLLLALAISLAAAGCGREETPSNSVPPTPGVAISTPPQSQIAPSGAEANQPPTVGSTPQTTPVTSPPAAGNLSSSTQGGGATGQDSVNTAAAKSAPGSSAAAAVSAKASAGQSTYAATCVACHGTGVLGSPKLGDKVDWQARIARGRDTLYQHAINGYTGQKGVMPPKGGNAALPDTEVRAAVDYMITQSQ